MNIQTVLWRNSAFAFSFLPPLDLALRQNNSVSFSSPPTPMENSGHQSGQHGRKNTIRSDSLPPNRKGISLLNKVRNAKFLHDMNATSFCPSVRGGGHAPVILQFPDTAALLRLPLRTISYKLHRFKNLESHSIHPQFTHVILKLSNEHLNICLNI